MPKPSKRKKSFSDREVNTIKNACYYAIDWLSSLIDAHDMVNKNNKDTLAIRRWIKHREDIYGLQNKLFGKE